MIDPHGELTERGQKIEDASVLRRVAHELGEIARHQERRPIARMLIEAQQSAAFVADELDSYGEEILR